ncbi:Rrf2 family transcriptional regulator [Citrobacter freundii complex sp. CFNIH2]|uniref:Rrf2 family transcriptional regulator n=1 Tax=Citrobacter freundii complex sp. CFNIH2 TaxID=2066049 RepID=UPI000C86B508|nr:Rrf2 family transcriptional regulator [Citrobacter freundii complex sp. CFNIH2]AUO63840.1 Rrf2 family transcriptional regulator [Citrobacter freundii complex sp. CFNIH2]
MKVIIEQNGETIWMRDSETLGGIACTNYVKDGTQKQIIAVLEDALYQAKAQLLLPDYVN